MSLNIATHKGANEATEVEQQVTTEEQQRPLSAREMAMAAIEDTLNQQMQEQGVLPTDESQPPPTEETTPPDVPATDQPGERLFKVKVDGEEREVPESELVKNYQIEQAARKRLEEATALLNSVREKQNPAGDPDVKPQETSTPSDDNINVNPMERARNLVDGLVSGDIDNAIETLSDIFTKLEQRQQTPTRSPEEIAQVVEQTLAEKEFEADYTKAVTMFSEEYADINANPKLAQLCNIIYFEQLGAGKKPTEAARIAGDEVRGLITPKQQTETTGIKERQERKQNLDTIKPAAATSQADPREESNDPASIIAEIKRQRGQT